MNHNILNSFDFDNIGSNKHHNPIQPTNEPAIFLCSYLYTFIYSVI